jgi:Ca-activated chloride channel family protein
MRSKQARFAMVLCLLGAAIAPACGSDGAQGDDAKGGLPPAADSDGHSNDRAPAAQSAAGAAAPSFGVNANPSGQSPSVTPSASTPLPAGSPPGASTAGSASRAAPNPAPPLAPPPPNGEPHPALMMQPFVLAAHDPFSTFGADVDTASYDLFRRNVEHNLQPSPDAVRVEDFVNYFNYDYPAPAEGAEHPFQISLAAAPNAFGRDTVLLRVGIQAMKPPASDKKPTNLVFLIDTSGSMAAEDKLPLVQFLAKQALDLLAPDDTIAIVTYSDQALVRLEPTPVLHKDEIISVVDSLTAGNSTNGAAGIQLAYEKARAAFREGGINHVMMCTDGDFNVGISDPAELVKFIEEKRKSGITMTALGFGIGNLNDELMERVSNAGNGIYSVITSRDQASRYAEERMLATLRYVAKDMKIQLEWNPEQVEAYRLIGYENRAIADQSFRDDKVDAGEVGAGHRVTALYEIVRKGSKVPMPEGAPAAESGDPVEGDREIESGELVRVKVRYKAPDASESDAAKEVMQKLAPSEIGALFDAADKDLRWAAAIAAYAEILRGSPYAIPTAKDQLRTVFADQANRDFARTEFLKLFDAASAIEKATLNGGNVPQP